MPLIAPESVILLVYMLASGLLILLGLPLYFRKVPPNRFYGFRTGRTLADPEVWYAVNRVTGGWMVLTGAVTAGVATWAQRVGFNAPTAASINLATFVLGMALMMIQSLRTLWRMK
ncbi:MAG: SdpI family protein [Bythopirellula sp.]|nr:SdpI family protein [Bythopirellula sp.]